MGLHPIPIAQSDTKQKCLPLTSTWCQFTSAFKTFLIWAATVLFVAFVEGQNETESSSTVAVESAKYSMLVTDEAVRDVLNHVTQFWIIVLIILVCYCFTSGRRSTHRCISSNTPVGWHPTPLDSSETNELQPSFDSSSLISKASSETKLKLRPITAAWRQTTHAFRTFLVCVAAAGCVAVVEGHDETANATAAAVDEAPYKDFSLSPKNWVIVLGCVVIFWILLSIVLVCFCANTSQECHLCEQPVKTKLWESGKHWKTCAAEHERYLHDLPGDNF